MTKRRNGDTELSGTIGTWIPVPVGQCGQKKVAYYKKGRRRDAGGHGPSQTFFFSSGMADVALRLGSEIGVNKSNESMKRSGSMTKKK